MLINRSGFLQEEEKHHPIHSKRASNSKLGIKLHTTLDSLLKPKSITILGASKRKDSVGDWALTNLIKGGYKGAIYPINPSYDSIQNIKCYERIRDLPEIPDLVIFAVSDYRIELLFDEVVKAKIPAAVIFSSLNIDDDNNPNLKTRIKDKILKSNMMVCGANGMGFYNIRDHVWACGFDSNDHSAPGNISLISHSGSGMSGILDCEDRLRFNFAVSTGNELSVTMDQYLDFVLDLPETKVVGIFIETARNPDGFIKALKKANQKKIPIVALKVGKTEKSAQLTVSHSGAIAGDDDAYDALFNRYGVQRVRDTEELVATLILFAEFGVVGEGNLVTLHDSGGERQLLVDIADELNVPLTELSDNSVKKLEEIIDPELPAINPLDVWSRGGKDSAKQYLDSAKILLDDDNASIEALVLNRAPYGLIYPEYINLMQKTRKATGKPVLLVSSHQGSGFDPVAVEQTHRGYPVLDGISPTMVAISKLFSYRDFFKSDHKISNSKLCTKGDSWKSRLRKEKILSESDSLSLLSDYGIPVVEHKCVSDEVSAIEAAKKIGYPLVLKTAEKDIYHKTERHGVILNIKNKEELTNHYRVMSKTIGKKVLIAKMIEGGQEMFLGVKKDPQLGPIVIIGMGGVFSELFDEVVFAIPPFNRNYIKQSIEKFKFGKILSGYRGKDNLKLEAFYESAEKFSILISEMKSDIREFDINPMILTDSGCVAVDALAVGEDIK